MSGYFNQSVRSIESRYVVNFQNSFPFFKVFYLLKSINLMLGISMPFCPITNLFSVMESHIGTIIYLEIHTAIVGSLVSEWIK